MVEQVGWHMECEWKSQLKCKDAFQGKKQTKKQANSQVAN